MKKIIVVFLLAIITISCNNVNESETQSTPTAIGVEIPNDSTRISLYGGDITTTRLWEAYIKAHNEKDLKTIQNINHTQKSMSGNIVQTNLAQCFCHFRINSETRTRIDKMSHCVSV